MFGFILVMFTVLIIFLSNLYFRRFCSSKLKIRVYFDDNRATEQDELKLNIEAVNRKLLIIPVIKISLFIDRNLVLKDETEDELEFEDKEYENCYKYTVLSSLLSFQRMKTSIVLKPVKRGYYTLSANVVLIDLFGFSQMKFSIKNMEESDLFVAPKPKHIEELINDTTSLQGNVLVKRWISPDSIFYSGVRPYDLHDSFKDIDWKATAKLGELYVKKYDYTSDPSIMIFIDTYSGNGGAQYDGEYVENAISLTASLVNYAQRNNLPVGFGTNSYMKHYVKNITFPDTSRNNIILINDMLTCMEYISYDTFKNTMDKYLKSFMDKNVIVFIKYEMSTYLYNTARFLSNKNYKVYIFLYKDNEIKINDSNVKTLYLKKYI